LLWPFFPAYSLHSWLPSLRPFFAAGLRRILSAAASLWAAENLRRFFPGAGATVCCHPRGFRICTVDYLVLTAQVDSQMD
jgi:hypothetical protein